MPAYNNLEDFLEKVCEQIQYRGAHTEIKEELKAHIEDHAQSLIDCGWDNRSAISKAIESMGDPIQIGKALNKIHKPYIGWLVAATNILIVIFSFHLAYILISNAINRLLPIDIGIPKEQIKYVIDINQKGIIDDRTVVIKKLILDNGNNAYILFEDYTKPFSNGWSMLSFSIFDDKGNEYWGRSYSSGNLFGTRHVIEAKDISEDAKVIMLNYDHYNRKMRFEIPLIGSENDD